MLKLIDFRFWGGDFNTAASKFDCGNEEINQYLRSKCRDELTQFTERLILVADEKNIYGFISVSLNEMRTLFFKEQNFSVIQVNEIGIDWNHQNKGFGTQLLLTAFQLALTINQFIPIGGLFLVALSEAFEFYEKFDLTNLNAPPQMVPMQNEFQMVISIQQIESLGLSPFTDFINFS